MIIKVKDLPKNINEEQKRIEKIVRFLKEREEECFTAKEVEESTGIKCAGYLFNNHFEKMESNHICKALLEVYRGEEESKIINHGDESFEIPLPQCGKKKFYYYKKPIVVEIKKEKWWKARKFPTHCLNCNRSLRKEAIVGIGIVRVCNRCGNKFVFEEI